MTQQMKHAETAKQYIITIDDDRIDFLTYTPPVVLKSDREVHIATTILDFLNMTFDVMEAE